jgi:serine phosphatase RsbU (regulator of sigma subunit)
MRCAISWLTSPASISPRHAGPASPPGECSPASLATTGGDIVCSAQSASAIRLLVGDVMGHGPRAACTSAEVMRAFRDLASRPDPVQDIAAGLHEFLIARPRSSSGAAWDDCAAWDGGTDCDGGPACDGDAKDINEEYVTALIISAPWDADGEAQIVNCGHPAPLLLPGHRGRATLLDAIPSSPPLGLLDLADGPACPAPLRLGPGDSLLLYTDGVTEARDSRGRLYPLAERAAALSSQRPARQRARRSAADGSILLREIQADLLRHTGGTLADDATMLLVTLDGEPSRPLISPVLRVTAAQTRLSEAADCRRSFLG